jgi:hypothetical protein
MPLVVGHWISVDDGKAEGLSEAELFDDENLLALCAECNAGQVARPCPLASWRPCCGCGLPAAGRRRRGRFASGRAQSPQKVRKKHRHGAASARIVGTFWAHLGTNQGNQIESHWMLFRRSQPFRCPDLGHAEGSNPSATAMSRTLSMQVDGVLCGLSAQSAVITVGNGLRLSGSSPGQHGEIPSRLGGKPGCDLALICRL